MREWWSLGRWRGVPVRAHWTLVLWLPVGWVLWRHWLPALMAAAAYALLMLVHEAGHAVVARRCGLHVHGIELQFLHGACIHDAPYYELDDIRVAWAGVAAQAVLLLVALGAAALLVTVAPAGVRALFAPWWHVFVGSNLLIIAINLLPFETLDGHTAWRVLPYVKRWWFGRRAALRQWRSRRRRTKLTVVQAKAAADDAIERARRRGGEGD